jgi:hypothetical protein
LSAHRTAALQAEVARHPQVALVAVVHRLALRVVVDGYRFGRFADQHQRFTAGRAGCVCAGRGAVARPDRTAGSAAGVDSTATH